MVNLRMTGKMLYVKKMAPIFDEQKLTIILVLKGSLKVHKLERSFVVNEGGFTFINRYILHHLESEEGANILVTKVNLESFSYMFEYMKYVEFMNYDELSEQHRPLSKNMNTIVVDALVKLYQMQGTVVLEKEREFLEHQLMYNFFLNYQLISHIKDEMDNPTEELQNRYYQIVCYIMENIHTKITTEDILNQVYMNAAYFSQFMKRIGGVNFKEFVAYRKLIFTCTYLIQPHLTMTDIASRVGISDMKTFYSIFKKRFHMSPAKYREIVLGIKDDFIEYQDMTVLNTFCDTYRVHRHRDNTITKRIRYLQYCEEQKIDLSHTTIYINPFSEMGDEIDPDYQVYKNFGSFTRLLKRLNIDLALGFPMTYFYDENQLSLMYATLLWHISLFGIGEVKKWQLLLEVKGKEDVVFAKEIEKELYKRFGPLNVSILMKD